MTRPIILVKICYELLYVIQRVKIILIKQLLGLSLYQTFGHTYLFAMLLLVIISLSLFYAQGVFA